MDKKKIPALRFPGFVGEWEKVSFDGLANIIDCKHRTPPYVESGIPVISPGTIKWGEIDLISPTKRVTEEEYLSLMDHCTLEYGNMVFSRNQSIGVASILFKKEKFVLGQDTVLIQVDKANTFFIYYRIQTNSFQTLISKLSGGSTFSRINLKDIHKLNMNITHTLSEQKRIADFLTAVDDKINQLTRKKTLLEQYKKGVMQKIFSQEIRFPGFEGEWNNVSFNDVADKNVRWSITGGPFGSNLKSEDYTESGVRIIQLQNIGDGEFRDEYKIFTTEEKADELRACNIYPNEIILSKMGDPVARACFIPADNHRYLMASDGIRLLVDSSLYNNYYVLNYINSPFFRKNAIAVSTGSTRQRIGLSDLKKLKINFPTLPEQKKIADFLTGIDKKIELVNTQLEKTKEWKRGLLQQMFV